MKLSDVVIEISRTFPCLSTLYFLRGCGKHWFRAQGILGSIWCSEQMSCGWLASPSPDSITWRPEALVVSSRLFPSRSFDFFVGFCPLGPFLEPSAWRSPLLGSIAPHAWVGPGGGPFSVPRVLCPAPVPTPASLAALVWCVASPAYALSDHAIS